MYKEISKCRICGGTTLTNVMSLGIQALTGTFPATKSEEITCGPVDLIQCTSEGGCGLVQLKQSYDINEMYGINYGYRSGLNPSMVSHLHSKVDKILSMDILQDGDLVIDIGSNDATTLKAYPQGRYKLAGIDPTGIKFSSHYSKEIRLIPDFFTADKVSEIYGSKKARVITSFSMFYDLEAPIEFAKQIESSLHEDGIWVFEQSYLPSMLKTNSFDTICHEHLEFYGLTQIFWIARAAKLKILDVEFNDVNGGSFSVIAAKESSKLKSNAENLKRVLDEETQLGINTTKPFLDFKVRVLEQKKKLMDFLIEAKSSGKLVAGLGASTKGNVLLQYYGITSDLVAEIAEVNEEKFGHLTPATHIPLMPEDDVLSRNPDYLLVLPWHFRKYFEISPKFVGKKLIFPLPEFEIVQL
jgi:hypothetical protein